MRSGVAVTVCLLVGATLYADEKTDTEAITLLIQKRADNPEDLKLLEVARPYENKEGGYSRYVVFRCKLVGYYKKTPVVREEMLVEFSKNGKIKFATLMKTFQTWN